MIRVLLVDDHPVVRQGLRTMLVSEPHIEVVGEAWSGQEAVDKAEALQPEVILMDVRMPDMDGIEATRRIKRACPTVCVIMLTIYDSDVHVIEAVRAGAAGYLTKDCSRELLCHAIQAVADGGTLVRSGLLRQAVQGLVRMPKDGAGDMAGDASSVDRLTPREREVLTLLAQGHGNREICAELYLAEVTVKKHVQSIIGKLGVSDRTQAAIAGFRLGLVA